MPGRPTVQSQDVRWLFRIVACFAVVVAALVLLLLYNHKAMEAMLRDRTEWGGQPFYLGAISQIGILIWGAGAAVALFTAAAIGRQGPQRERLFFLRCIGLFSLILCLDDAFQVHEVVAPRYLFIDQKAVLLLYAMSAVAIALTFRRLLLERPVLPVAAVAALAISVGLDLSEPYWSNQTVQLLTEDSFKQLGILLWTGFILQQALVTLSGQYAAARAPGIPRDEAEFRLKSTSQRPAALTSNVATGGR